MAELEKHLPYALRQFETEIIFPLQIFGIDASLSKTSLAKITTVLVIVVYFLYAMRARSIIPDRVQASAEWLYSFVADTVIKIAGPEARPSIPFLFSIFIFILVGTLLGLMPLKDTFTSHLAVTLGLSFMVFAHVNFIGIKTQGWGFLRLFLPAGVPGFIAPVFVFVELISYLFRPITLGFRLFANIFAGHVMLKLFADFCTMMLASFGAAGWIGAIAPVLIMVILYGFEVFVICIQAYVFLLLSSMYLRDALHAH